MTYSRVIVFWLLWGLFFWGGCAQQQAVTNVETMASTDTTEISDIELSMFDETLFINNYDTPPIPVNLASPKYPYDARKLGLEGVVLLELFITEEGIVQKVDVIRSLQSGNEGLDQAAIEAAMQSSFMPALQQGTPVPVRITLPFQFSLK